MKQALKIVLVVVISFGAPGCDAGCDAGSNAADGGAGGGRAASAVEKVENHVVNIAQRGGIGAKADAADIPDDAKFVSPDGDDAAPGTENQPWRHILTAFERLEPGDTLVIRGGIYTAAGSSETCLNGNSPFGLVGKHGGPSSWTTVMGYPGERPKLYHPDGWQTLYICNSSYVRIRHLEVFGDANGSSTAPVSGVYVIGSHHVEVSDVWSHDNGGCGICSSASNHIVFDSNRVWGNSRWNQFQTSGISIHRASNEGGGDNPDGYSNYVMNNLVWNNWEDESIGEGNTWGITDGNGIIIDVNIDSGATGRTLILNNILVDNGGPGVMITRSRAVDILSNTLYQNVRTRVPTVVNNGDIGCNRGNDLRIENNVIVPRDDNPNLFRDFNCGDYSVANNVWVRTGAPSWGPGDIVLPSGAEVFSDPRLTATAGCWTAVGSAAGRGAR